MLCDKSSDSKQAMSNSIFSFATTVANEYARLTHFEDRNRIVTQLCYKFTETVKIGHENITSCATC